MHQIAFDFCEKNNATTPHSSRETFSGHAITVSFVNQKNERLFDSIVQENTGDYQLILVKLAASLVWRVRNYPGINDDKKVCCYHKNHKLVYADQYMILNYLRSEVLKILEDKLGISTSEIGNK